MIWIFWVCWLSLVSHGVECWLSSISMLTQSLSTPTGLPDRGALPSKKSPAWNIANHSDMFHQSQHLLHTQHKPFFFAFQLCFYLSWNNKAQYAENVTYFLTFSISKWLHKNSPILMSSLNVHLHNSCHNTTQQNCLEWS